MTLCSAVTHGHHHWRSMITAPSAQPLGQPPAPSWFISELISGCSGLQPIESWNHSRTETGQPLWATCLTVLMGTHPSTLCHLLSGAPSQGSPVRSIPSPTSSLPQTEQAWLFQPLLTGSVLQPLHLRGLSWTTCLMMYVSYWMCRCGLTTSELRWIMTPLDLLLCPRSYSPGCSLAVLLLGLAADPCPSYWPSEPPGPSPEAAPLTRSPSLCCCAGLIHPWGRTWHYFFLNFIKYLSVRSSSLPRSLWVTLLPASEPTGPPIYCHLQTRQKNIHAAPAGVAICLFKRCILFYKYFLFRSLFCVPSKILFLTGVWLHSNVLISYLLCPKCVYSDVLSMWCFLPNAAVQWELCLLCGCQCVPEAHFHYVFVPEEKLTHQKCVRGSCPRRHRRCQRSRLLEAQCK